MKKFVLASLIFIFFIMQSRCEAAAEYWWDSSIPRLPPDILKSVTAGNDDHFLVRYGAEVAYWPSVLSNPEMQIPLIGDDLAESERWPDFIWVPGAIQGSSGSSTTLMIQALRLPEIPQEISEIFPDDTWDVWKLEVTSTILQDGNLVIRESPTLLSCGFFGYKALSEGGYLASSFFDVFTELSIDGGQTWTAADGISFDGGQTWATEPMRFTGVPEPAILLMLAMGGWAVMQRRRERI